MSEKNLYRNSLTGLVEHLHEDEAAVFPHTLELVPAGTKPFLPEMFTPGLVGERAKSTADKPAHARPADSAPAEKKE